MNTSQESPPSGPAPVDDAGGAALVGAMETASAAIWCLAGPGLDPVWANARARDVGTGVGDLAAAVGGRVAELAAEGRTNREIAERLFISERTVGVHVRKILAKLGVAGRVEAASVAIRLGLVAGYSRAPFR